MIADRDDGLMPPDADDPMVGSADLDAELKELAKKMKRHGFVTASL